MKTKEKIKMKIRNDNQLSLKLALSLDIHQSALFRRIERNSKALFNDIRVINVLKDAGFTEAEIFES